MYVDPLGLWKITPNGTILMEDFDNPAERYIIEAKIAWQNATTDAERQKASSLAELTRELLRKSGHNTTITADTTLSELSGFYNGQKVGYTRNMRFGLVPMGDNGCGIIATFNALLALDDPLKMSEIVKEYELRNSALAGGKFGLNPFEVPEFLEDRGHSVTHLNYLMSEPSGNFPRNFQETSYERLQHREIEKLIQSNTITILLVVNDKADITRGMHYVSVQYIDGRYHVYNRYSDMDIVYDYESISDFAKSNPDRELKITNAFGIS